MLHNNFPALDRLDVFEIITNLGVAYKKCDVYGREIMANYVQKLTRMVVKLPNN